MRIGSFAAILSVLASGCSLGGGDDSGSASRVYTDDTFGYSLRYPGDWHLDTSKDQFRITACETTVANFDAASGPSHEVRRERPRGLTSIHLERDDRLADFPPDGVALRIFHLEGGPGPDYWVEEADFPLSLDEFMPTEPHARLGFVVPSESRRNRAPQPVEHYFGANGWAFRARAWVGPAASAPERALLERVVASLRFPPLQEGAVVASERFEVLGRAEEYPVGSATKFGSGGEGFHLVHAPGGFYALRGYCQDDPRFNLVHFDRSTFEFFCPDGERWNRIGAPLERGGPSLMVLPAKVAQDGHVLVARGVHTFASARMRAKFWPP